jgi:predicted MFS family arabinose efflux permease
MLNFLPRYLGESDLRLEGIPPQSLRNGLTGAVLLLGCVGQYLAGRFARPDRLTPILVCILLSTAPFLFWMSFAQGTTRIWAAAFFALTHFSHQPIYNSLVAHYVPSSRRSLGFGLSNFMSFGLGSFGAGYAGYVQTEIGTATNYGSLAFLALLGATIAAWLYRFSGRNGL